MKPLLIILLALPVSAQFQSIEIAFEGINCASCVESLPVRLERIRGVESAKVDANASTVRLKLSSTNRVRLEQVRDAIEQDGTRVMKALVTVKGQLAREEGRWMLHPSGVAASYAVEGPDRTAGTYLVDGEIADLKPTRGPVVIAAASLKKPE